MGHKWVIDATKYENICIRGFYYYTTLRVLSSKLFVSVHGME